MLATSTEKFSVATAASAQMQTLQPAIDCLVPKFSPMHAPQMVSTAPAPENIFLPHSGTRILPTLPPIRTLLKNAFGQINTSRVLANGRAQMLEALRAEQSQIRPVNSCQESGPDAGVPDGYYMRIKEINESHIWRGPSTPA